MRGWGILGLCFAACCLVACCLAACAATPPEGPAVRYAPGPPPREEAPFPARPELSHVLARSASVPSVAVADELVAVREGDRVQADLAPNPVLGVRGERIEPGDLSHGVQRRAVTLSERLETAGKREARVRVSEGTVREARAAALERRLLSASEAASHHQDALSADLLVAVRSEALSTAEELLRVQQDRISAGRLKEAALLPLRIRVGESRAAVAREKANHRSALRALERTLALTPGSITGVTGVFVDDPALPAPSGSADLFAGNPEIEAHLAAEETSMARVRAAEAKAVPDVTVGVGFMDEQERPRGRMQSFGVSVEAPLPVIDRNQGGIAAARSSLRRAEHATRDVRARIRGEYAEARDVAASLRESVRAWVEDVIPARERDLALATAAHEAGRTDMVPVLSAKLALAEARVDLINVRTEIASRILDAWTLLGRLTGGWDGL